MWLLDNRALSWLTPRRSLATAEVTLVALLAMQTAQLAWVVVAPDAPFETGTTLPSETSEDIVVLSEFNPFAVRMRASPASASSEGLKLFGVRSDGKGGGSAIIANAAGKQSSFAVGDEISPGMALQEVGADHVVISRGEEEINLPLLPISAFSASANLAAIAAPVPSYLLQASPPLRAAATAPVAVDPKVFLAEAGLRPRRENGQVTGYTLFPRGGGDVLASVGLQSGDVLVAVNGNRITPERMSELEQELTGVREAQLTVERGSQSRTIVLKPVGD